MHLHHDPAFVDEDEAMAGQRVHTYLLFHHGRQAIELSLHVCGLQAEPELRSTADHASGTASSKLSQRPRLMREWQRPSAVQCSDSCSVAGWIGAIIG